MAGEGRTIELTRGEVLALLARQEMSAATMAFVFGVPESQAGRTDRLRDLLRVDVDVQLEAGAEFVRSLAPLGLSLAQLLEERVQREAAFREFVNELQRALTEAVEAEGAAAAAEEDAAPFALPVYRGALRLDVHVDAFGERWAVSMGPRNLPYTVRVGVRVASKAAAGGGGRAIAVRRRGGDAAVGAVVLPEGRYFEDAEGRSFVWASSGARGDAAAEFESWLMRAPHTRLFRPAAEAAVCVPRLQPPRAAAAPLRAVPALGLVGAGWELLVTRSVGGFATPRSLAVGARGELYVAETSANRLAVVSEDGAVQRRIKLRGAPVGVGADAAGRVWVALLRPAVAQCLDADGAVSREVGAAGGGEAQGAAVCALRDGSVALATFDAAAGASRVAVYPAALGAPAAAFDLPARRVAAVAETPAGALLVSSHGDGTASLHSRDGALLRVVASPRGPVELQGNVGQAAVGADGAAVLAAWDSGSVLLLDAEGALVHALALAGAPAGAALLREGVAAVSTVADAKLHILRARRV
jgi:hypothetical protein